MQKLDVSLIVKVKQKQAQNMANHLKINKKPGWVVSLLLKAYVNFFRFSNFDFGSLLYIGVTAISAPQNTLRSLLFRDSNHVSPAYFIVKSHIYLIIR